MDDEPTIEQGFFSLVRWCPDAVRAEYRNLGVILVGDQRQAGGVRYVPPSAMPESLAQQGIVTDWFAALARRFETGDPMDLQGLRVASRELWVNLQVTEPRPVAVLGGDWESALEDLWRSYAKPLPRPSANAPLSEVRQRLRALIQKQRVVQDQPWNSPAGVPWILDFYANSGANVALDTLQLALKRPREILIRAAGEAYKIRDIRRAAGDLVFVVYCAFSPLPAVSDANEGAQRILEAEGARVASDPDEAAREFEALIDAACPQPQPRLISA